MTAETNNNIGKKPDYFNNKDGVAVWVKTNAKGNKQFLSIQLTVLGKQFNVCAFPPDYNEDNQVNETKSQNSDFSKQNQVPKKENE